MNTCDNSERAIIEERQEEEKEEEEHYLCSFLVLIITGILLGIQMLKKWAKYLQRLQNGCIQEF